LLQKLEALHEFLVEQPRPDTSGIAGEDTELDFEEEEVFDEETGDE